MEDNDQKEIQTTIRYLNTDDYFMCASGLFPARVFDGKDISWITKGKQKRHLTNHDTATYAPDFTCKWAVILAVAAAVFCALLLSNPVGWAILAGLIIGLGIGMLICGVMMAMGRTWYLAEKKVIVEKEKLPLPSYCYMKCAIGGVITWQPQITSGGIALWTGIRNLGFATLEGIMYGYAAYGGASLFTKAGLKAAGSNLVNGWLRTVWNTQGKTWVSKALPLFIRGAFAAEDTVYNYNTGRYDVYDENGNKVSTDFLKMVSSTGQAYFAETAPYISVFSKLFTGKASEISAHEVVQMFTIPLSFIGLNIHASEVRNGLPSDQIPKELRDLARKLTGQEGQLYKYGVDAKGKVEYGESDLSREAIAERNRRGGMNGEGNVSVFEWRDPITGELKTKAFATDQSVTKKHAERIGYEWLESQGIPNENITRIYSELQPCELPSGGDGPGGCKEAINERFPDADVTYSYDYPGSDKTTRPAREQGMADLKEGYGQWEENHTAPNNTKNYYNFGDEDDIQN